MKMKTFFKIMKYYSGIMFIVNLASKIYDKVNEKYEPYMF